MVLETNFVLIQYYTVGFILKTLKFLLIIKQKIKIKSYEKVRSSIKSD